MAKRIWLGLAWCAFLCGAEQWPAVAVAEEWRPVPASDLVATSDPNAPGAQAIYLYRSVDRDDINGLENNYLQIKVFKDEGRKYADVEIPFDRQRESIRSIQARVIQPDGTVQSFNGTVFEKPLVLSSGAKLMSKTFTLPGIQVGCVIEYQYTRSAYNNGYIYDSEWILSQDLFTRVARFRLLPSNYFPVRGLWPNGLPAGTPDPKFQRDSITLESHNIPAFLPEDHAPPERQLKYRVQFVYIAEGSTEKDPKVYWRSEAHTLFHAVNHFADRSKAIDKAVASEVSATDSTETKVRKLYKRVLGLRNTTYERQATEQEQARAKEDARRTTSAADVISQGFGEANQITWTFLALLQSAGIKAEPLLLSTRDRYFFNPALMNPQELNSGAVLVHLDDRDVYLDPGVPFTPFGLLPWYETSVVALRMGQGGEQWVNVPSTAAALSRVERVAKLKLDVNGTLEGTLSVSYTGHEAQRLRTNERLEDETDRTEYLEQLVRGEIATGIDVKLTNSPDWEGSEAPLTAEFSLTIPGYATAAGSKLAFAQGLFSAGDARAFTHANRTHPIYFEFPYTRLDDVDIELASGLKVATLPVAASMDLKRAKYSESIVNADRHLHLRRETLMDIMLLQVEGYPAIRSYYEGLRAADAQQVVVERNKTTAGD